MPERDKALKLLRGLADFGTMDIYDGMSYDS